MKLKNYLSEKKTLVNDALRAYFPTPAGPAANVMDSMRYSLFAGGKRLRPILCMAAAEAVGGNEKGVIPAACALECIHTYSLIHDDLPVMDDDDLRRGKPTNHKRYGEAVALLAGDGLLTEAFRIMATSELSEIMPPQNVLDIIALIAKAAGYEGMVGGQTVDIQSEGKAVDFSVVEFIHNHKTGALITASVASGAVIGGGNGSQIQSLTAYGQKIGKAYQISDDILNIEGDSKIMGKRMGSDEERKKVTYPAVIGLRRSKETQSQLIDEAIHSLSHFGQSADPLREIARYIIQRNK